MSSGKHDSCGESEEHPLPPTSAELDLLLPYITPLSSTQDNTQRVQQAALRRSNERRAAAEEMPHRQTEAHGTCSFGEGGDVNSLV